MPDIRNFAISALLGLAIVLGCTLAAAHIRANALELQFDRMKERRDQLQEALDGLNGSVKRQKEEATALQASINASLLAKQHQLETARAEQEKKDATHVSTVDRLRGELRAARLRAGAESAARGGGGGSGGNAIAQAGPAAGAGAGGGADAPGLLPDPEVAADEDAYRADRINLAYASCRADAIALRAAGP